jgi:hypothetical protein
MKCYINYLANVFILIVIFVKKRYFRDICMYRVLEKVLQGYLYV